MEILQSELADLGAILALYDAATELQRSKGTVQWPKISTELVESEIREGRQWKLMIEGELACVWVVAYDDELIWGPTERSVFLHRIANNPSQRGKSLVGIVVEWAKNHCNQNDLRFIRLDTVGYNPGLIRLYTSHGFSSLEPVIIADPSDLPAHYAEDEAYLFEIDLGSVGQE